MSAEFFLDTNVLVYSFDGESPAKQKKAQELIEEALVRHLGIISWQVVQEFLNVALHRWSTPMPPALAESYLTTTLIPLCRVFPSPELYASALRIRQESGYRFYDCLIVAAAIESGVPVLFSEDLQPGRRFGPLTIVNPFS